METVKKAMVSRGGEEDRDEQAILHSAEGFYGSENTLYDIIMMDI